MHCAYHSNDNHFGFKVNCVSNDWDSWCDVD